HRRWLPRDHGQYSCHPLSGHGQRRQGRRAWWDHSIIPPWLRGYALQPRNYLAVAFPVEIVNLIEIVVPHAPLGIDKADSGLATQADVQVVYPCSDNAMWRTPQLHLLFCHQCSNQPPSGAGSIHSIRTSSDTASLAVWSSPDRISSTLSAIDPANER